MSKQAIGWAVVVVAVCCAGCRPKAPPQVTQSTIAAPTGPSEVELYEPKFTLEPPQLIRFEVKYRFVKGSPTKNYLCTLTFPGTSNTGQKPLAAWELKPSGVIKGGIELQSLDPPATTCEVKLGEADVPQNGYETISNVVSGEVTTHEPPEVPSGADHPTN